MGISCGPTASLAELDGTKELGLGWVRVSHEAGWAGTTISLGVTAKAAHARGLKVLQCIQLAGHKYSATDLPVLQQFAINCLDANVDAIEIGNEYNNSAFFQPHTLPPILAASLTSGIAKAIRAKNPLIPIITNGLSPAPLPWSPHTYWPTFWDANAAQHKVAGYTANAAIHPFVYPEDPCTMMSHPEWNPWAGVAIIRKAMSARGATSPIWFTEVGCPGTDINVPYIRGIGLTEARQAFVTTQYLKQYKNLCFPLEPLFIATLFDGESVSVPGPENYLGLIRKDGTKKPAWKIVHDFAAQLLP